MAMQNVPNIIVDLIARYYLPTVIPGIGFLSEMKEHELGYILGDHTWFQSIVPIYGKTLHHIQRLVDCFFFSGWFARMHQMYSLIPFLPLYHLGSHFHSI